MVVASVVFEIEGLAQRANPRRVTSAQKPGPVRVKTVSIVCDDRFINFQALIAQTTEE